MIATTEHQNIVEREMNVRLFNGMEYYNSCKEVLNETTMFGQSKGT